MTVRADDGGADLTGESGRSRSVAVVTGGGRGIGAATARLLAAAGCDVAIGYRRRMDEAERVAAACRAEGVRALPVRADLADPRELAGLFATVDAELGPLSVLVNNAGIVPPAGRVETYDAARVRHVLDTNVTSVVLACGEAVRRMSTRHGGAGGVIVNVSSIAARLGAAGEYVDYAASKAAVDTLTTGLAREVVSEGVRVVGVRPGTVDTDIHAPGRLERVTERLPLGRPASVDEVASAIAWLAVSAAPYTTGAILDVCGAG
jgi:NAD(P)-dependent dehydrogenase (short-subunit alcohol dehydrogenase family)